MWLCQMFAWKTVSPPIGIQYDVWAWIYVVGETQILNRNPGSKDTCWVPIPFTAAPVGMYVLNWKLSCINSQSSNKVLVPMVMSAKPDLPQHTVFGSFAAP